MKVGGPEGTQPTMSGRRAGPLAAVGPQVKRSSRDEVAIAERAGGLGGGREEAPRGRRRPEPAR